ncbi:hypothetical protein, partial [Ekhidna sp.]|uniref:hypothetical protein n=1 Tax=Ekhidna sp. TaxID=2608089 RepID=UPI003518DD77
LHDALQIFHILDVILSETKDLLRVPTHILRRAQYDNHAFMACHILRQAQHDNRAFIACHILRQAR